MADRNRLRVTRWISLAPCLALLALSCRSDATSSGGSSSTSKPAKLESAHFLCSRVVEGGPGGNRPLVQYEIWMRGNRTLITSRSVHILRLGKETYSWSDGRSQGGKVELPPADERSLLVPSVDYVVRAGPCRDRGKQNNRGTQDGHPFVSYQCQEDSDGSTRTYHLATDLQDFPVRARIVYPDRTIVTYTAKSPEVPGSFPDSMFDLPRDIVFKPIQIAP